MQTHLLLHSVASAHWRVLSPVPAPIFRIDAWLRPRKQAEQAEGAATKYTFWTAEPCKTKDAKQQSHSRGPELQTLNRSRACLRHTTGLDPGFVLQPSLERKTSAGPRAIAGRVGMMADTSPSCFRQG